MSNGFCTDRLTVESALACSTLRQERLVPKRTLTDCEHARRILPFTVPVCRGGQVQNLQAPVRRKEPEFQSLPLKSRAYLLAEDCPASLVVGH